MTTSDSHMCIDFAYCIIFLAHMPVWGTDRLIICHATLIKTQAECWQLSSLHCTDQWPQVKLVAGVSPMTHTINQTDTPKTDVVHTSPGLSQGNVPCSTSPDNSICLMKATFLQYICHSQLYLFTLDLYSKILFKKHVYDVID